MAKNIRGVLDLFEEAYDEFIEHLCEQSLITVEPWATLASKFKDSLDLLNDNNISGLEPTPLHVMNPIDKYSLATEVKHMHSIGKTIEEISKYFNTTLGLDITPSHVKQWLTTYQSAPITKPTGGRWGNVFDVGTQLQTLFEDLNDMIEEVKMKGNDELRGKSDKSEILLSHSSEKRQLLKDAKDLLTTVKLLEDTVTFKTIILQEIREESPAVAQRIIKRLSDVKQTALLLS